MTNDKKRAFCSECYVVRIPANADDDVCDKCNAELALPLPAMVKAKAAAWAASHKCRQCKKGLPLSRYFECETCVPEHSADDPHWDMVPTLEGDVAPNNDPIVVNRRASISEKSCACCKATLPVSCFGKNSRTATGYQYRCMECQRLTYRRNTDVQSSLQEV